jgi:hypothetical protein
MIQVKMTILPAAVPATPVIHRATRVIHPVIQAISPAIPGMFLRRVGMIQFLKMMMLPVMNPV